MQKGVGKPPRIQLIQAGRWWNKDVEIVLLGISENREHAVFGECRYTAGPVDANVYRQLTEKTKSVHLPDVPQKHFVFFIQPGFRKPLQTKYALTG